MNRRNYNIYFHLHTITGIISAVLLFIIFFAGSFSFFKSDIEAWENNSSYKATPLATGKYQKLLDSLDQAIGLYGRDINLLSYENSLNSYVYITTSKDTLNNPNAKETRSFVYNYQKHSQKTYAEAYGLSEFLYRLHFLAQLNIIPLPFRLSPFGYLIAGLTAFVFLMALITGILIHWDKIISNFYLFRPWSKIKTMWTDIHTVLGTIGLPFQLIYAITGFVLIVNVIVLGPFSSVAYKNESKKMYNDLNINLDVSKYDFKNQKMFFIPNVDSITAVTNASWGNGRIKSVAINNYGDENMVIAIQGFSPPKENFSSFGKAIYEVKTKSFIYFKDAVKETSYVDVIYSLIYKLHYGNYGGYFLKAISFVLGVLGCLVMASGIMIWFSAREKNNIAPKKRKFNFWATNIFLSTCLSMLPVTAISFIIVKLDLGSGQSFLYNVYFYTWLAFSIFYIFRKNLPKAIKEIFLISSVLALIVPIVNGITTGNWVWKTAAKGMVDILIIDLLWIFISVVSILSFLRLKNKQAKPVSQRHSVYA
ncbi:PepSY-associated TM helix domain-containing protein [Pseudopedobacter sp.]|uniref:PepSY-associated TM helix domain-containing protein n=1 Tax=Pseudopedobacter sp. TaxID=1936787 RepID=UPI00333E2C44